MCKRRLLPCTKVSPGGAAVVGDEHLPSAAQRARRRRHPPHRRGRAGDGLHGDSLVVLDERRAAAQAQRVRQRGGGGEGGGREEKGQVRLVLVLAKVGCFCFLVCVRVLSGVDTTCDAAHVSLWGNTRMCGGSRFGRLRRWRTDPACSFETLG